MLHSMKLFVLGAAALAVLFAGSVRAGNYAENAAGAAKDAAVNSLAEDAGIPTGAAGAAGAVNADAAMDAAKGAATDAAMERAGDATAPATGTVGEAAEAANAAQDTVDSAEKAGTALKILGR